MEVKEGTMEIKEGASYFRNDGYLTGKLIRLDYEGFCFQDPEGGALYDIHGETYGSPSSMDLDRPALENIWSPSREAWRTRVRNDGSLTGQSAATPLEQCKRLSNLELLELLDGIRSEILARGG